MTRLYEAVRRIPLDGDEHLLRGSEDLFAFGPCRLCGGTFTSSERRDDHLAYHQDLFAEYAPQRRQLERHVREQEERLGARLVCETAGMRPVTEKQLARHEQRYGSEGVDELVPYLGLSRSRQKPRRNEKRIGEVQRLFEEHVSVPEISSRTGLTRQTVKKYLAMAPENGVTKPSKMHSTAPNGSNPTETLPAAWDTPKKRSLGGKVVGLYKAGMTVSEAISDRLGKSDRVVRRYLREAEAAGLLM